VEARVSVIVEDDLVVDTDIWPALNRLVDCLCTELAAAGLDTCYCGLLPGDQIAAQYVDQRTRQGMAWVRLVGGWPYSTFPAQDSRALCAGPVAFEVEIGSLFCAPAFADSRGNPPSLAAQLEAVRVQMAAMAAMRRAIVCCLGTGKNAVLGQYVPIGPEGDVVGGTWNVIIDGGWIRG
jgi:hypothetical protein